MIAENYPNIEKMCRLCLKEDAAEISIFQCEAQLWIPMRIMSCCGLEVHESDNLPNGICSECRYQLEKSFYFRKRSQYADGKLKKHLRLLSLGKRSRVFVKCKLEDGDDDEDDELLEFEDSLKFIKKYDDEREEAVKVKQKELVASLKPSLKEEVRKEVEENYQKNVLPQMRLQISNDLRKNLKEEVKEEVKQELIKEVQEDVKAAMLPDIRKECREEEIKSLLSDLGSFLKEKRCKVLANISQEDIVDINQSEDICVEKKTSKRKFSQMLNESNNDQQKDRRSDIVKSIVNNGKILCETAEAAQTLRYDLKSNGDENNIDPDNESNGFLILDDNMETSEINRDDNNINDNHNGQENNEDELFVDSPVSYHIEENESLESFSKRKSSLKSSCKEESEGSIVILNYEQAAMDDEQLEMVEFVSLDDKKEIKNQDIADIIDEEISSDGFKVISNVVKIENSPNPKQVAPSNRLTDTPKTFRCSYCPMKFATANSYNRHAKTHMKVAEKGVSYQCRVCFIHVSCKSALTRHMIIHTGEKPYACEECGKSFVQREVLKRHMQTHTGVKPYKCSHCGRDFAQKTNLTTHINKNHSEVPIVGQHSCPLCPKRFNHSSGLSRHLATHSGIAFQCTECDRTFSDRSSVKRHVNYVHNMTTEGESIK